MPKLDILAALEGATPRRGARRCRTMAFLESIPGDTPGRDELIRLFETDHDITGKADPPTRSAQNMVRVLGSLGWSITHHPILDHRNHVCACYR